MTDHDTAPGPMSGAPDAIDVPTRLEEIELRLSYYSKSATPGWYRDDVRYLLNLAKAAIAERDAAPGPMSAEPQQPYPAITASNLRVLAERNDFATKYPLTRREMLDAADIIERLTVTTQPTPSAEPDAISRPDPIAQARIAFEVWRGEPPYGTALRDTTTARAAAVHLGNVLAAYDAAIAERDAARARLVEVEAALAQYRDDTRAMITAVQAAVPLSDVPDDEVEPRIQALKILRDNLVRSWADDAAPSGTTGG